MSNLTTPIRVLALVVAAGALIAVALGAGRELGVSRTDVRGFVLPASQIISWDQTVGMLDTANGAIYKMRGALHNSSVQNTWEMRVPPVKGTTSGLLELQVATFDAPDTFFLVDIVTGSTWILRTRTSSNRSWEPVKIFR